MREHATRLKVRKLYILGAGASYDASQSGEYGCPLDKDILEQIQSLDLSVPHWINEYKESLERTYKSSGQFWKTGLELAVIRQLGQLNFLKAFHAKRARDNVDPIEWLDKLNTLVCARLKRARPRHHGSYWKLAESVQWNQDPPQDGGSDRVITFNYDTLLDDYFTESYSYQEMYFANILDREDSETKAPKCSFPMLLKLHGSINWRCSTEDFHRSISNSDNESNHYIGKIWVDNSRPSPSAGSRPLMVPPLPDKPITAVSILKYLWRKAYEYLYEADELCIAGYSLPATDVLAKSMFSSFVNTRIKSVHIADPDGGMINKWREVLDRQNVNVGQWKYSPSFSAMIDSEQ